ncbi:hypothetical protein [Enterobacter sp. 638]|uniref:Putative tail fiber protein gp53-like C-terminal domain-containing protein n=1 Tax=Enterobacter sp. (strain 638) TaxID=399742 RepID=A0A9J9GES4_ENT38|nr:hypothetical protein [Enterobacter sp. 638]ABP59733.1 hypothetical protein Ent638_1051 [Enterobacter sp. 638]
MALLLLAANNAQSVLAAGISASATTMTLNTGTGALFPSPVSGTSFFKLTFIDAATGQISEIVHVTARSGDSLTIVRAQEGTVARAWSVNDIAANMMTAGTLSYILDNYATIASLGTAATKDVGTGAGQIPDMSSFPSGTNYYKMPGGKIVQFGIISFGVGVNQVVVNYPVAFPSAVRSIVLTWTDAAAASGASSTGLWYAVVKNTPTAPLNQFTAWLSGAGGFNLSYIAIGE